MTVCITIPNGYDRIDAAIFDEITPDTNMFSLAYVGALYEGKRDIGPLFSVLRQLCDEGIIQKKQIVFHYAGGESLNYMHG